jgi:hypothetical protein
MGRVCVARSRVRPMVRNRRAFVHSPLPTGTWGSFGGSSFNDGTTQTARDPLRGGPVRTHWHVGVDLATGVTAPAVVVEILDGGLHRGSFATSHGTRAATSRANPMSRVLVVRSRVRPMVRLYIAHVGIIDDRPTWSDCGARRCGLDGAFAPWLVRMVRVRAPTSRANPMKWLCATVCVGAWSRSSLPTSQGDFPAGVILALGWGVL